MRWRSKSHDGSRMGLRAIVHLALAVRHRRALIQLLFYVRSPLRLRGHVFGMKRCKRYTNSSGRVAEAVVGLSTLR